MIRISVYQLTDKVNVIKTDLLLQEDIHFIHVYCRQCTVKRPPTQKEDQLIFKTDYRLMQVKSIAECFNGSILQYFRPSLSYRLLLRSLFCLFLRGV